MLKFSCKTVYFLLFKLKVFLTLSADDLKVVGLDKFGPRRKMTNAIESWHKENSVQSALPSDTSALANHVERLELELKERNSQLNQVITLSNVTNKMYIS